MLQHIVSAYLRAHDGFSWQLVVYTYVCVYGFMCMYVMWYIPIWLDLVIVIAFDLRSKFAREKLKYVQL